MTDSASRSGTSPRASGRMKHFAAYALTLLFCAAVALPLGAESFDYQAVSDAGFSATRLFGISNNGQSVSGDHGGNGGDFSYTGVTFTEYGGISDGLSSLVFDARINNAGDVAGTDGSLHAFELINGSASALIPPGATESFGSGINDSGMVSGSYYTGSGGFHGFTYQNGVFTGIDVPGATSTEILAIDDAGDVAGAYGNQNGLYGFILKNGVYTTIFGPGGDTLLWGIDSQGHFAGNGADGSFFFDGQTLTAIAVPGATSTTIEGMNELDEIVGTYTDAQGNELGFIATPESAAATPEPGTLVLLTGCVAAMLLAGRNRR